MKKIKLIISKELKILGDRKPIHIFGHLNPDTDSICSAIAYAYLKNRIDPSMEYIPAALGMVNEETGYVLKYYGVEEPKVISHLKPQVLDIEFMESTCVHEMDSLKKVLEAIIGQVGRSVPVVDDSERLIGIVSISDVVPMLLSTNNSFDMKKVKIPIKNLIEILELTLQKGRIEEQFIQGNIYMCSELSKEQDITSNDIILCNKKELKLANKRVFGAGYIVVCDTNDETPSISEDYNGVVFTSPKSVFEIIQNIIHALPISSIVKKDQLEYFTTYETIDDVKKNFLTSKYRRFPVVDEAGFIKGMISRSNLMEVEQKKAILVDHNERGQSIEGIENITIVEVIDHHRVADIQTISPLYFRVEPVGSTCTIVAKTFEENNIKIPKQIAGILLSGILSDTLVFKSPTCTEIDKVMAEKLAMISGVNIYQYGMKMITKGEKLQDKEPEQIITGDMKRFTFGQYKVVISQINTADFAGLYQMYPKILEAMEAKCKLDGLDLAVLMVTNIVVGGTEVIATGEARWIAENAFNMTKSDESIFLNQTFSRKKQIVPKLMKAAQL
ncbi:MAG: manganese-dependent inorganic pyrophosphatase [Firmicutes bacterium HGW-Firmicutes-1]|jgi:manganese-dependent inorganic pyrophosphatase|nr:MAG: manganese-dependent inorganic pyrophosphatase [Firmicutes bacterium HGW-Firmicutes-1]